MKRLQTQDQISLVINYIGCLRGNRDCYGISPLLHPFPEGTDTILVAIETQLQLLIPAREITFMSQVNECNGVSNSSMTIYNDRR